MSSRDVDVRDVFWHVPPHVDLPGPFAMVDECVSFIEGESYQDLSPDELRRRYEWFTSLSRASQAIGARYLAEIDRREKIDPDPEPHTSTSCWLQNTFHVSGNAAYFLLRTARQLDQLPETDQAFRRGELGPEHVSVICRAMDEVRKTSMDSVAVESELVEAARRMTPLELRRHWSLIRYQADQDAGVEAEQEQRDRRWVRFSQTRYDTYRIEGELDPESGAVVKTALKAILGRQRAPGDERTSVQRTADAVVELARRSLDAGELPAQGGEKPHLMLIAQLSTLQLEPGSPLAKLDWGPQVTGQTARRIAEDADVTPILVDDEGDVLHVGRRARTLTRRQRKALDLRDQKCQFPGCDRPPELCVPHHLKHWIDGGTSDLPNTALYCEVHHPQQHPENDRFRKAPP